MSTNDLNMDLGPALVLKVPTGLISGTIKGAVKHILDELAYHGYSNDELVEISVLLAQAALDDVMNEAQGTNQFYKLDLNLDEARK